MATPVALSTGPSCAAGTHVLPCATTAGEDQLSPARACAQPNSRIALHMRFLIGCAHRRHESHARHRRARRPTLHVRQVSKGWRPALRRTPKWPHPARRRPDPISHLGPGGAQPALGAPVRVTFTGPSTVPAGPAATADLHAANRY